MKQRTDPFSGLRRDEVLTVMYLICAVTAVLHAYFIQATIHRIVLMNQARQFLDQIGRLPGNTSLRYLLVVAEVLLLAVNYVVRRWYSAREDRGIFVAMTLGADLVICLLISYQVGFNYNGIVLWAFAELLNYANFTGFRSFWIVAAILIYIVTSPQMSQVQGVNIQFNDCLAYYSAQNAFYIRGLFNLLDVAGITWFVVCCLNIIAIKQKSIDEIEGLNHRISEANEDLKRINLQLENLMEENSRIVQVQERNRIAREVHDSIGHTLTGLSFGIEACESISSGENEALRDQLSLLSEVCRQGIEDVRLSVASLRADIPERRDLATNVTEMMEQTARVTGTSISHEIRLDGVQLDAEESDALYRVVQESITNAILHGHASAIRVEIYTQDAVLHIYVHDNGSGCKDLTEGFGITHMRERIHMLQGEISFADDHGFVVNASVPIRKKAE